MDLGAIREKPVRFVIGLTSDPSCDGIDAALVRTKGTGARLRVKLVHHQRFPYLVGLRTRLTAPRVDVREAALLNFELGDKFADAALAVVNIAKEKEAETDIIALNGHTLAHMPPRGDRGVGILQVGEPAVVAEKTGLPVISDFHARDMAAGGQGAPLQAYADWALFAPGGRTVACLDIGGISSLTIATPALEQVVAFDVGPGTLAIDGAMWLLTSGAQDSDKDGAVAAKGVVVDELLEYLLDHSYFSRVPPKSAGRDDFSPENYLRDALMSRKNHSLEDLVATVTAAVAFCVVRAYNRFVMPQHDVSRLIVSGPGAVNTALMAHLKIGLPDTVVRTSDAYGIPHRARKAIAIAILGNEFVCQQPANVPHATGAAHPAILGRISPP